jgi:hypothetical protein
MTTQATTPSVTAADGSGRARPKAPLRTPLPIRERRPGYIALAVLLIVGLAALGAYLYAQAGAKTPVVKVVRAVPAGHRIDRADLSTTAVAGGVTAVAGSNLDSVVGKTAAVQLLPDMLLMRSMVTDASPLSPSVSLVGVALRPGQLPDGLAPGDTVAVLATPGKDAAGGPVGLSRMLVESAKVYSLRPDPSAAGGMLVSLLVPASSVPAVTAAGGTGLAALARVAS